MRFQIQVKLSNKLKNSFFFNVFPSPLPLATATHTLWQSQVYNNVQLSLTLATQSLGASNVTEVDLVCAS